MVALIGVKCTFHNSTIYQDSRFPLNNLQISHPVNHIAGLISYQNIHFNANLINIRQKLRKFQIFEKQETMGSAM